MEKYNSRNEVPEEFKWDLTEFFKDEDEFNETFKKTQENINKLAKYVGCTEDAKKLNEFLNLDIETVALWERLYVYAYLINDQELGVAKSMERKAKTEQLEAVYANNISFFAPELLKVSKDKYDNLFKECSGLLDFKAYLDRIYREKDHILSESEEIIVSELTSAMNHFDDMSSNMLNSQHNYGKVRLSDGTTQVIATNNYRSLMKNKDVSVRKKVYNQFNKRISEYSSSNALFLSSYVAMNDKLAKIRHYKDSWNEKLFSLNLSDKVFKSLVSVTERNLDSLHRYYDLKKKVLGLPVLHMYDLPLELVSNSKEYSIPEAQKLVREAIKPLGSEYVSRYDKIISGRFIDYCQYKGKCSGGYSFATMDTNSRILMSYNGHLDSVSTIAHECGHNIHHQFLHDAQPRQYRDASSIVAEVVSLTNECLLSNYLVENGKTKEEKLAGLANIIDVINSNLFGAVREGKLEQDMYSLVHKGGSLTKEYLDKKTKSSLRKYYGNSVKLDKYACNSWVTRSHYYMNFYLYSYSICISVATNVASRILSGDKEMLDNYIKFLQVGSDSWPSEAFKVLGIDLEDEQVYQNAINYYDSLISKFNEILEKEV